MYLCSMFYLCLKNTTKFSIRKLDNEIFYHLKSLRGYGIDYLSWKAKASQAKSLLEGLGQDEDAIRIISFVY